MIKVKIIKSTKPASWYANFIGQTIDVVPVTLHGKEYYEKLFHLEVTDWWSEDDNRTGEYLEIDDCEIQEK
jgi:hypothetical protein